MNVGILLFKSQTCADLALFLDDNVWCDICIMMTVQPLIIYLWCHWYMHCCWPETARKSQRQQTYLYTFESFPDIRNIKKEIKKRMCLTYSWSLTFTVKCVYLRTGFWNIQNQIVRPAVRCHSSLMRIGTDLKTRCNLQRIENAKI